MSFHDPFVFSKYRYQVLKGDVGLKIRELIRQTCQAFEIDILKGVVSKDHVHLFVSLPPNIAPSEIMRCIKGRSSAKVFESFPELKKRYWGGAFLGERVFLCDVRRVNRRDDQKLFGTSFRGEGSR